MRKTSHTNQCAVTETLSCCPACKTVIRLVVSAADYAPETWRIDYQSPTRAVCPGCFSALEVRDFEVVRQLLDPKVECVLVGADGGEVGRTTLLSVEQVLQLLSMDSARYSGVNLLIDGVAPQILLSRDVSYAPTMNRVLAEEFVGALLGLDEETAWLVISEIQRAVMARELLQEPTHIEGELRRWETPAQAVPLTAQRAIAALCDAAVNNIDIRKRGEAKLKQAFHVAGELRR